MSGENVELKAVVKSDSQQANEDLKKLDETVKKTGDDAKATGGFFQEMGERLGKMNPKELAERIMSLEQNFQGLGDVMDGIASNDAKKFEQGMSSALRGVTGLVALVAPEFAPIVAILTPLITKTAEWALGLDKAAEAQRKLAEETKKAKDALEDQTAEIDRQLELENARTKNRITQLGNEIDAIKQKMDIEEKAYVEAQARGTQSAEDIKAYGDTVTKLTQKIALDEIEIQQLASDELIKIEKTKNDERLKARKQAAEDSAKIEADWAQDAAANSRLAADAMKKYAEEGARAKKEADLKATKAAQDAAKTELDIIKKVHEEEKKSAEDARKKVSATYQSMFDFVTGAMKDWRGALAKVLDDMTRKWVESMAAQSVATEESASRTVVAQGTAAKGFEGATASVTASNAERIRGGILGFFAPLGPFGAALATALIGVFMGLLRSKIGFEEGGAVRDRVPGLGRHDNIDGKLGSDEGVLTGRGMATTLGEILGAVNRGSVGSAALPGGGAMKLEVIHRYDWGNIPSDRTIVRSLMKGFNVEVRRFNGELEASHLRDS